MIDIKGTFTPVLEEVVGQYGIYTARRQEYATDKKIPFRVAPTPFQLTIPQHREILDLGQDITGYFRAVDELYRTDERVRSLLDRGKPDIFVGDRPAEYLFVRPDLILTPAGMSLCEIETSPFGLSLAEMLNRAYHQQGYETLVEDGVLSAYIRAHTPSNGLIVHSPKTQSYRGQLAFMANEIFSGEERSWVSSSVDDIVDYNDEGAIYRGLYLGEYVTDPEVRRLLEVGLDNKRKIIPSLTPYLEEKAALSFIWDSRFEKFLHGQLGSATFDHLREVIPPTWIVGQEQYFALGMPEGVSNSVDIASLSRSKRPFVLKESGFGANSSWAEGVVFLQEKSSEGVRRILTQAVENISQLYIIQLFRKAKDTPMMFEAENGELALAPKARVRLTPYYSMNTRDMGRLLAAKVTGCENTDLIHGSSSSINSAVS